MCTYDRFVGDVLSLQLGPVKRVIPVTFRSGILTQDVLLELDTMVLSSCCARAFIDLILTYVPGCLGFASTTSHWTNNWNCSLCAGVCMCVCVCRCVCACVCVCVCVCVWELLCGCVMCLLCCVCVCCVLCVCLSVCVCVCIVGVSVYVCVCVCVMTYSYF